MSTPLTLSPVDGLPLIKQGDDLAALLIAAMAEDKLAPKAGDVLVLAQKIVSKAEGRAVRLCDVTPGPQAQELAAAIGKDARMVELILGESRRVVRTGPNLLIVENRNGLIMANAGIDRSNVADDAEEIALLLPLDPDASAARLRTALSDHFGMAIAVLINDSFGRPWRRGTAGTAIGVAGLPALIDMRGKPDLFGTPLQHTEIAFGDEIAAAASLLMGQASEGRPAILISGLSWQADANPASALQRPAGQDLFR
ncbi:coenzyme F420-0:L-glutamate ligase [Martelella sp. HB161492]|uniref:coenzyme F420-0:L-glutamate ligase n=1 Tax=Martelella sp. HB161492 TaxID=2720726 RepID=UPI00159201DB|nr:coenzyme F420-0:L-glutamate ligase [Martelella sp. HB161492]